MPCWHIDEKTCSPTNLNIQKPPQLEGETCPLGTNHNKDHPSFKSQLLLQPHEEEKLVKPNQLEWGW
jgi:hypothetical protein